MKNIYIILFFVLVSISGYSNNYNMSNTSQTVTCGSTDNFYDPGGSAGNYGNSQSFTMTISPGTAGQYVAVSFTSFTLEATYDFLYVYDGTTTAAPLIGAFHAGAAIGTITSTTGSLTFRFTSDAATFAAGWAATVTCSGTPGTPTIAMNTSTQTIACGTTYNFYDSGGNPSTYGNSLSYTLTVNAGTAGQCVSVSFTSFTTESACDFLYVYDGASTAGTLLGTYSGAGVPPSFTSTTGSLTFRFTSDGNTLFAGWSGTFSCTSCPVAPILMSNTSQTITCGSTYNFYDSGGSGSNYGDGLSYTMTITPSSAAQCLSVTFTSFTLEATYDYLYIYNGTSTAAPLIGSYTGGSSPGTITATSGSLTFRFYSDAFTNSAGWAATVSCTSGCSGTPTAGTTAATATSLNCTTTSAVLSLTGATTGCGLTYQWQSSPDNVTWTNIAGATSSTYTAAPAGNTYYHCIVYCGAANATSTSILISTINCYLMSNATVNITSCPFTGNFYDSQGSASNYLSNETYTMTFNAPAGSCLSFNFTSFGTEANYDYFKIFDGPSSASTQIGPALGYNGVSSPGTVTSSGTSLTFVFTSDAFTNDIGWAAAISCAASCSGTPTAGTANASQTLVGCGGITTTVLSLSGVTSACGLTYQWQSSPDNSTWSNIAGATLATYTATPGSSTYYHCVVSCGASGAASASTFVNYGPPANDLCANATSITMVTTTNGQANYTSYSGTIVGSNICATADGTATCFTVNKSVWYKFVPPVTGNYYAGVVAGTLTKPQVAIISACGAVTNIGCAGSGSASYQQPNCFYSNSYSYTSGCTLTGGVTYYVLVDNNSAGVAGTFTLTVTALSNDQIGSAAMIANCGTTFNSSTIGASNCGNGAGDGDWNDLDNNAATTYTGNCCGADVPSLMSVENESWFQFCSTSLATFSITLTPSNSTCIGPNAGTGSELQWILYTGSPSALSPSCAYVPFGSATTCTISLAANACAYIMVDGSSGTNCDYSILLQANPGCPLPIELLSFNGINEGNKIKLDWNVATEKDIRTYVIEKSANGLDYSVLSKVLAAGYLKGGNYSIYDERPFRGSNYYRLSFVDNNGVQTTASHVMVTNKEVLPYFTAYPNPSSGLLSINLTNFSTPKVTVEIFDVYGNQVWNSEVELTDGGAVKEFDVSSLTNGVYFVKATGGSSTYKQSLVIAKRP